MLACCLSLFPVVLYFLDAYNMLYHCHKQLTWRITQSKQHQLYSLSDYQIQFMLFMTSLKHSLVFRWLPWFHHLKAENQSGFHRFTQLCIQAVILTISSYPAFLRDYNFKCSKVLKGWSLYGDILFKNALKFPYLPKNRVLWINAFSPLYMLEADIWENSVEGW